MRLVAVPEGSFILHVDVEPWSASTGDVVPLDHRHGGDTLTEEVMAMEQIVIRNLPAGTVAALRRRADRHQHSLEVEAREILTDALGGRPAKFVDLLSLEEGTELEFEPGDLGVTGQTPEA